MSSTTTESGGTQRGKTAIKPVAHFSVAERVARGKAARAEVPRKFHAEWEPSSFRPDPVELLEEQAKTRVEELVPIRYGRMLVSPFTFYRGAAYIMAADLAGMPRTGLHVQLCGDAHLSNFGGFAAPDRRLVFDINDFDETLPGPFEWDLKRLVASFAVAGRSRGFDAKQRRTIALHVIRSYRESIAEFAAMRTFDLWYSRFDVDEFMGKWASAVSPKAVQRFERNVAKARTKDSLAAFSKLTHVVDGERRFVSDPPLIVPARELISGEDTLEKLHLVLRSYRATLLGDRRRLLERFRFVDAARKVVGVGSVGTRAWVVLFVGRDDDDPLVLQVKEAQSSVLEPSLGKSEFGNHGQRVVEGQRLMQAASDMMLGWLRADGIDGVEREFYVRQLWDSKASALVDVMEPATMEVYGRLCGQTLARAHARSGDAIAISSYLGSSDSFDQALASFAELYADQNEKDYAALQAAVEAGRIDVLKDL
ncbi:MAG TPA: DUF2252 domain-containing protein [Gaiellaceae bacterium]|nr:DUF2252 domain-containing protein [Gaiellaceae bacterium]